MVNLVPLVSPTHLFVLICHLARPRSSIIQPSNNHEQEQGRGKEGQTVRKKWVRLVERRMSGLSLTSTVSFHTWPSSNSSERKRNPLAHIKTPLMKSWLATCQTNCLFLVCEICHTLTSPAFTHHLNVKTPSKIQEFNWAT